MRIIYLGSEVPSNRTLLTAAGVTAFGFSYMRARKRGFPKTKQFSFKDYYPEGSLIVVHPGLTEITGSQAEIEELAADYQDFVLSNLDELAGAVEFHHDSMSSGWIDQQRRAWVEVGDKFWPVWNGESFPDLYALADEFPEVALSGQDIDSQAGLSGQARAITSNKGTVWHGMAVASPDNLRQVPLTTASTGSWQSPMRRGETIVWDGVSLKRYPKKMKDQARPRYKALIEAAGLDYEAVLADDAKEVTRLAIWSYQRLEENMDKKKPPTNPFRVIEGGGDPEADSDELITALGGWSDNSGTGLEEVDHRDLTTRNAQSRVPAPREAAERRSLPSMGVQYQTIVEAGEDGRDVLRDVPVVTSSATSLRQCNTCFVAANCPAFKPDSECAFHLPVEIKTRDQLKALLQAMIEMQASRVAFGRFAEELNGGYPDPNLSQEMDRLFKLVGQLKEMEANKERLSITMERQGSAGVLSSIFGDRAQVLRELENGPLTEGQTNQILRQGLEE